MIFCSLRCAFLDPTQYLASNIFGEVFFFLTRMGHSLIEGAFVNTVTAELIISYLVSAVNKSLFDLIRNIKSSSLSSSLEKTLLG